MHVPCILKVLATITSYYYNQKEANNNRFPDFLTKKTHVSKDPLTSYMTA